MAKKQREKEKLFEEIQIQDFEQAKRMVTFAKINQIRIFIGLAFAIVSTYFTACGILGSSADNSWIASAIFCAVPAYVIGGGIGKAFKTAWKIAKIGWFLIPVFPADLFFGFWFLVFACICLLFAPIIFVGINFIQHNKTLNAAKRYLAQCGHTVSSTEE